ncbi:uncharacterized protein CTRU02_207778 [Colletotrichum truncatum]|uniref:Uncharacterized protein n=1 Tax=Colletotrichum truncatum TaxID=5467 RepID=A0ACC3Z1S4_COLTU|nr:uncharacterized protein CTRU02_09122 [Colletotrichum truncatum]KAF6788801.1 hypothetical protein CTRU02_09122 [Colletotrichum truncatum]
MDPCALSESWNLCIPIDFSSMPAKNPTAEPPPLPYSFNDLNPSSRIETPAPQPEVDTFLVTGRGTDSALRAALPAFNARQFLSRCSSAEILAEPRQTPASPAPTTPPFRSPSSSPARNTPDSGRGVTKIRVVELETTPSSSRSKGSVDTEGDIKMLNAAFSSPDFRRMQFMGDIRAMVTQSVHDNFEFERGRFADEVKNQLLATLGDEIEWLVGQMVDCAVVAALEDPLEGELDAVRAVRERLRRMSDEARVRVFCTAEMLEMLRRLVGFVDLELRTEGWTLL